MYESEFQGRHGKQHLDRLNNFIELETWIKNDENDKEVLSVPNLRTLPSSLQYQCLPIPCILLYKLSKIHNQNILKASLDYLGGVSNKKSDSFDTDFFLKNYLAT
jgi:hypothetical protein